MTRNTLSPKKVVLLNLIFILFQFSCSKDSDLLAEYVALEDKVAIDQNTIAEDDNSIDPGTLDNSTTSNSGTYDDSGYVELKAFPTAEGFGKYTTGGRGGIVLEVTNLNDNGEGSLRNALASSQTRTIVFKVSGYIDLNSPLNVQNGNVTIAGQTAPGDGITLRRNADFSNGLLNISAKNVIIRGLKIRTGTRIQECCGDNVRISSSQQVVLDHCSLSWSIDESLSISNSSDVTVSNCIISESLNDATHIEGLHSKAAFVTNNSTRVTFFNNLFAHNVDRNPLFGGQSPSGPGEEFELVNNVLYNWGNFGIVLDGYGSPIRVNLINNVSITGSQTSTTRYSFAIGEGVIAYARNNYNKFRISSTEDDWEAIGCHLGCEIYMRDPAPLERRSTNPFSYPTKDFPLLSRSEIIEMVLGNAGAFSEDAVDKRIKDDVINGTGNVINSPNEVGGYPTLISGQSYVDADKDGMADEWEVANNLDPKFSSDRNYTGKASQYTLLEIFLQSLVD